MQKCLLRTNFCGQATPTKIKPTKVCIHVELATVIMVGYSHPQKFILSKIYPFENLPTKYCEHGNFYVYGM